MCAQGQSSPAKKRRTGSSLLRANLPQKRKKKGRLSREMWSSPSLSLQSLTLPASACVPSSVPQPSHFLKVVSWGNCGARCSCPPPSGLALSPHPNSNILRALFFSYITSNVFVVSGRKVNLVLLTPSCLEADVVSRDFQFLYAFLCQGVELSMVSTKCISLS